ncbi:PREDICTED: golgin subfamily A member 4-like isoform X3 [Polistes canadensis]|uniref:golgin subfamily A member 4-like isoform X3 n=1 Tax=Polistes canadensis TaxID=91411 RepID=UPI000718BD6C|nr:PREDICTED: golgin subfamily A member 4-like isoform X3 [Polistes canadensis]
MSTMSEEDERRKRSLEAGRDLLEKYKITRSNKTQGMHYVQTDEQSDEESYHNDKSMDQRGSFTNEVMSSRDITQSSVSMSEGEADRDLEGMAGRVAELEELLQGKEAIVAALNAEIDHLRGETSSPNSSQSHNSSSSIPSRDVICLYHTKLQEFEKAINQRDNLIEDLTSSLEQALSARDALVNQLNSLNAARESSPRSMHSMNLQEKIDMLETTLTNQKTVINKLNSQLAQIHKHVQTLEMEKETRNAEISDYKIQINNLNEQIRVGAAEKNLNIAEMLEQQKQYEARVDKIKQDMQHILEKFTAETNTNTARHQQEIKDLTTKHESELKNICLKYEEHLQSLKEENKLLADRLNKELPDLESRHAKELSVFQVQLAHYKKTVETLKLELVNRSEAQNRAQAEADIFNSKLEELQIQAENSRRLQELNNIKEKELLKEQIELHKIQLDEITSKYVAATSVLESKESMERSLEQALLNSATLKQENNELKFQLDDLSSRYTAAQSLIESNQVHERTMSSRIYDLEKSLSRLSGINVSMLSELNETTYQTLDEVAIKFQLTKQKLEEKEQLEKKLIEKIQELENDGYKMKKELEQATFTNKSYEKQLKDTKNMCDKLETEMISLRESNLTNYVPPENITSSDNKNVNATDKNESVEMLQKIAVYENEIKELKQNLEKKNIENIDCMKKLNDIVEQMKQSEDECKQLKNGLAVAWAQCSEVEEKLNHTLAMHDSTIDVSLPLSEFCAALPKHFGPNKNCSNFANDTQNSFNETSNLDNIKQQNDEKIKSLRKEITNLTQENENLFKEMEHLLEKQSNYDEISNKLHQYCVLCDKLESEKQSLLDENRKLKANWEEVNVLHKLLDDSQLERNKLQKDMNNLIEQHEHEINAIKSDSAKELKAMQTLLLNVKEGNIGLNELKNELEIRHAKEMEELRTYFEQKCLQMEKQYSEEVFSQQSKKMSDNDSEIEELTEDVYFGGAGDCLSVGNISRHHSRSGTPVVPKETKHTISNEDLSHVESEPETSIKMLKQQLDKKNVEIQNIKLYYEKLLDDQKEIHKNQLKDVKIDIGLSLSAKSIEQCCQTEFDTRTLENGELSKLQAAYNHQLEEQVALARLDIVNALQEQIQALLSVETDTEDNWPSELLILRDKLTNNAKQQIQELKGNHAAEVLRLKEQYSFNLAQLIEKHKEEINKIKGRETPEVVDNSVVSMKIGAKESFFQNRDYLHKMCLTLKSLIGELIKYFAVCEEEVNNTLINEVLKRQIPSLNLEEDNSSAEIDDSKVPEEKHKNVTEVNLNLPEAKVKKVHFAPQSDKIISIINSDNETLRGMLVHNEDIIENLRSELNNSLRRLKTESAEILNIPFSPDEKLEMSSNNIWNKNIIEELTTKLNHTQGLLLNYQEESEQLKMNIIELQRKLIIAENKKEIITEGYGEHDETRNDITLQDFSQLQEKARHVLSNGGGEGSYLLQLIEELCIQSDKLMEDARKEKEDLQQQIEAADKQLKATRTFLEEQAAEREAERDESVKQINYLQEQLKEREREKERDQRITSENSLSPDSSTEIPVLQVIDIAKTVEALESQIRGMSSIMSDTEAKMSETESELKAAVDKIWVLRDIVHDLEQQLQAKIEREESLQLQITQLEAIITAQTKNQQDLVQELDSIKMGETSRQMNEHITHLQEELRKHKLSSEHFDANSSTLKQMKVELRDLQYQLDKRIKNLESLHISDSTLSISQSQPSEDVSIREQIDATRCLTPDDPTALPLLPLDEILKLKEKILKHARVEEAAFKKIKDLEMELSALKNQNEELQAEQEILQQTASEQLYQMEAMRGRLEQQKQSAPFAQRQATSKLELELHEANTKIQALEQVISDKELELNDVKEQLTRSNQLLLDKEAEIANVVQLESITIQKLKDRLSVLEDEKKNLQSKVGIQEQAQMELPQLIDSMLADKNEEIDHLKEQLVKKEKQIEIYSSMALDDVQLRELAKQVEPKNSARTLSDILSINSECEDVEAIRCGHSLAQTIPHNISSFKVSPAFPPSKETLDASIMPSPEMNKISVQVPPLDLDSNSQSTHNQNLHVSVDIDLPHSETGSKIFSSNVANVIDTTNKQPSLESKKMMRSPIEKEISDNNVLYTSNKKMNSDSSQDSFKSYRTSVTHTREFDNETMQLKIQHLEKELNEIKEELNNKTTMLEKREGEFVTLRKQFDELQLELKETCETLTRDKNFYKNQYELMQASENKIRKDLLQVENTLKLKKDELQDMKDKIQMNEKIMIELNSENSKLKNTIQNKNDENIQKYVSSIEEKTQELQSLREISAEKDIIIETIRTRNIEIEDENKQLYEYKKKYDQCERELLQCKSGLQSLMDGLNSRDQIIRRLDEMARRSSFSGTSSPSDCKDQEIHHLQEYLKEKDKVIRQISDDSRSLHRALETIQSKIKESGNIVELRKKLKEEHKINAELRDTVERLTKELEVLREFSARRSQDDTDIEDMVQRELNLSARLDKQIMNAIDSDREEMVLQGRERESVSQCSSPYKKRTEDNQYDVLEKKCADLKLRLKNTDKVNEELLKLKDELEIEKEMLKCQVAEYENRIFQIKSDLVEESKKITELDKELSGERNLVRTLKLQMEKNEKAMQAAHIQDNELIETLREKLQSSLVIEEKLRHEISSMRQEHKNLEIQLSSMREHIESQKIEQLPGLVDLLQTEQKKYIELVEEYEKEQRKNVELRDSLKKNETERNRYEKQLEVVVEEKESLVSSLVLADGIKEQLEIDLRRTKEELKAKEAECEWLQNRIKTMSDAEAKRQDQRTSEHYELKGLRRELENAREVIIDLEADMKQSKLESGERESKLRQKLESFKIKEAELIEKLILSKDEERKQRELVLELQQKLKTRVKKIADLTKELDIKSTKENNDPAKYMNKIKELMEINEKYSNEKDILHYKLVKVKHDKEQLKEQIRDLQTQLQLNKHSLPPNTEQLEIVDKAKHIYGKYLRAISKWKSLKYQKRYLICVIGSYELSEKNTVAILAQLTKEEKSYTKRNHCKRGILRFKSVALVIISIHRMKWMIIRWRTGRRIGANVLLGNHNQAFVPSIRLPTLNHSPPIREKSIFEKDSGVNSNTYEQYYQRLRNIQQTLGLAMGESGAVDDMSSE